MDRISRRALLGGIAASCLAPGCAGKTAARRPIIIIEPPETPHALRPDRTSLMKRELALPPRATGAEGARTFYGHVAGLGAGEREHRVETELVGGNVPGFLRRLLPIRLDTKDTGVGEAFAFVTPDYLCLGSDDDFVRIAITMHTVRKVAVAAGAVPPTRLLVDAIYAAAAHKITSPLMTAGSGRPQDVLSHHAIIEHRLSKDRGSRGELVAGCKKDVVITKRMLETPGRTAIYGWFLADGSVVQSLSLVHDDRFLDYVQGLRLVDRKLLLDGREADILDVLADKKVAPLVSDEGAFDLRTQWERGF